MPGGEEDAIVGAVSTLRIYRRDAFFVPGNKRLAMDAWKKTVVRFRVARQVHSIMDEPAIWKYESFSVGAIWQKLLKA
jgi:hypothetical protein